MKDALSGLLLLFVVLGCGSGGGPSDVSAPTALPDLEGVRGVAAGGFHGFALTGDGAGGAVLSGWGHNVHGQVGLGTEGLADAVSPPRRLLGDTDWRAVSAGALHTLAIDAEGRLWAWGYNEFGQLGLGDSGPGADRHAPTRVGSDTDWAKVAAGGEHSLARKTDGTLWAFGKGNVGQLGLGDTRDAQETPAQVGVGADWQRVAAGAHHSAALDANGMLFVWGSDGYGQLGLGEGGTPWRDTPVAVGDAAWAAVSAGGYHTAAIRDDGSLWAWGRSDHGEAGALRAEDDPVRVPSRVGTAGGWVQVSAGHFHVLALQGDGSLWAFGDDAFGQLGVDGEVGPDAGVGSTGGGACSPVPLRVGAGRTWDAASAGFFHSLGVSSGRAYAWGRNELGQLGND